jgi:hypothetical protein
MTPNYGAPLAGLLFVGMGIRLFHVERSGRAWGIVVAGISGWLGITMLVPPNGGLIDKLTGVDQLGTFLGSLLITFSGLLHGIFMLSLAAPRWARWRAVLLAGYGVFLIIGSACWIASHQGPGGTLSTHFEAGSPVGREFWYATTLIGYLATIYSFAPAFAVYGALYVGATRPLYRAAAAGGVLLFAPGVANGLVGAAATLQNGPRSLLPGQAPFVSPLVEGGIAVALAVTAIHALGGAARPYLHAWLSPVSLGAWARRNYRNMVNANVYLSERRVFLNGAIDQAALGRLADRLCARGFSRYQQQVGLEAARWLALNSTHAFRRKQEGVEQEGGLSDEDLLQDALGRADRDDDFYADVYRVVALILGAEHHPVFRGLPELPGWRRSLAAVIRAAMREHEEGNTGLTIPEMPAAPRAGAGLRERGAIGRSRAQVLVFVRGLARARRGAPNNAARVDGFKP